MLKCLPKWVTNIWYRQAHIVYTINLHGGVFIY